jgi:hypothetical protein
MRSMNMTMAGVLARSPRHLSGPLEQRAVLPRDVMNRVRLGHAGPLFAEPLRTDPRSLRLLKRRVHQSDSAQIIGGDWDSGTTSDPRDERVFSSLHSHFVNGTSWEETGAIDRLWAWTSKHPGLDGYFTRDDIVKRYEGLDRMFETLAREERMRWQHELPGPSFREYGSLIVSITRDGTPVTTKESGNHRLAMAILLDLEAIPAQIGRIHSDSLANWRGRLISG